MSGADRVVRSSNALAVLGVAAVAAVASYERAYELVRGQDETGWTAHMVPLTGDGLIFSVHHPAQAGSPTSRAIHPGVSKRTGCKPTSAVR